MLILKTFLILFISARIYCYVRCMRACIGAYRISPQNAAAIFAALWMFEVFLFCFAPISREITLLELFLLLFEMPALLLLSVCFHGKAAWRFSIAAGLPAVYWFGQWSMERIFFSPGFGGREYANASAVSVLLFGIAAFLIEKMGKSRQERERELLEQEIRMYENQFSIIRHSQHSIRSLKHDMKHHIKMLTDLVSAGENAAALAYLASMGTFMENGDAYVDSGNEKIDSILNYMLAKAKNAGIHTAWKIQIPERLELSAFDMNVILSNLMENAINALADVSNPELFLSIKYDRGVLYIHTKNNFTKKPSAPDCRILSSEHGYGLKNIQKIAEKYNGSLETSVQGGCFHVNILLFLYPQAK